MYSRYISLSVPDGDHQGAGLCRGTGERHSLLYIFPTDPHSISAAGLVSRAPRVSPVLLLAAPGLRVNLHKVGQGGHLENK